MAVGKTLVFFKLPAFERLKLQAKHAKPAPPGSFKGRGAAPSLSKVCPLGVAREVCHADPGQFAAPAAELGAHIASVRSIEAAWRRRVQMGKYKVL